MRKWKLACALGIAAVSMLAVSASSVAAGQDAHMTVVASGLDNHDRTRIMIAAFGLAASAAATWFLRFRLCCFWQFYH